MGAAGCLQPGVVRPVSDTWMWGRASRRIFRGVCRLLVHETNRNVFISHGRCQQCCLYHPDGAQKEVAAEGLVLPGRFS